MTEQSSFKTEELRDAFEKAKDTLRGTLEKDGTAGILQHLSNTVSKLQQAGIDISIEVISGDHAGAYDMIYTTNGTKGSIPGSSVNAFGYIRVGETQHLFAVANKLGENDVERLYLSQFNVSEFNARSTNAGTGKTHADISGTMYDFRSDKDALQKLQTRLIEIAAQQSVVMENDAAGVFNAPSAPYTKPAAKLKQP